MEILEINKLEMTAGRVRQFLIISSVLVQNSPTP